jgi:hypothetical protein
VQRQRRKHPRDYNRKDSVAETTLSGMQAKHEKIVYFVVLNRVEKVFLRQAQGILVRVLFAETDDKIAGVRYITP